MFYGLWTVHDEVYDSHLITELDYTNTWNSLSSSKLMIYMFISYEDWGGGILSFWKELKQNVKDLWVKLELNKYDLHSIQVFDFVEGSHNLNQII